MLCYGVEEVEKFPCQSGNVARDTTTCAEDGNKEGYGSGKLPVQLRTHTMQDDLFFQEEQITLPVVCTNSRVSLTV